MSVITVENLRYRYPHTKELALDGLDFSVEKGEFIGIIGENGAGKSTALECILGIKKPDSGEISILGLNPFTQRKQIFEKTGVQFQEAHYQDKITVEELCETTASLYRNPADYPELLRRFGIKDKLKSAVSELSGSVRDCSSYWRSFLIRRLFF